MLLGVFCFLFFFTHDFLSFEDRPFLVDWLRKTLFAHMLWSIPPACVLRIYLRIPSGHSSVLCTFSSQEELLEREFSPLVFYIFKEFLQSVFFLSCVCKMCVCVFFFRVREQGSVHRSV